MMQSILRVFLMAVLLAVGQCEEYIVNVQENSNFFGWNIFPEAPTSASSYQPISRGCASTPCIQPNFCYQSMSVRQLALIQGKMPQGSAAAIFNPVVQSLSPVAISFVPENGTAPDLPSNVHLLQEYVIPPNVNQNRFFLFTHEIGDVATLGEIVDPDGSGQSSNLKVDTYFNYSIASRVVYVTGQIGTQNISVNFQLPFRSDITMVFVPVKKLDNPPSQPVWIDWKHLTINVTGSASILEAIPGVLACALLIFFIVKAFTF